MIPFVGPSYSLNTRKADVQRAVNLYPVTNEVAGGKSGAYLQAVAGLDLFSNANNAEFTIDDVKGTAVDGQVFTLTITRSGVTTTAVDVRWAATGQIFNGTNGFRHLDNLYTGIASFAAGQTTFSLPFTLEVVSGSLFGATITLSDPSRGSQIDDAIGTLLAVTAEGLLNHAETLADSTHVYSVIGPNLATTAATLSTSIKKFDASSVVSDGVHGFTATTVQGLTTGRSWRFSCWFYPTSAPSNGEALIGLDTNNVTLPEHISLAQSGSAFAGLGYDIVSDQGNGAGSLGAPGQTPTPLQWTHVAMQYNLVTGALTAWCNGHFVGNFVPPDPAVDPFPGYVFNVLTIGPFHGYWDEALYEFSPAVLYTGTTYAVPVAPNLPPDPT